MKTRKNSYENTVAWQKGMFLVKEIYLITKDFPKSKIFGLSSQMQRCVVSIPSNIAEGYRRGTASEFNHFLRFAFGSGGELETQLKISKMLEYVSDESYKRVDNLLEEVMKLLHTMIKSRKKPIG